MRLRPLAYEFTVLGWSSLAIGAVGVALMAAVSDRFGRDLAGAAVTAVIFAVAMWGTAVRPLARRLAAIPVAPPPGAVVERSSARLLAGAALLALVVGVTTFIAPAATGVALGAGVWQLATAVVARRWEREHGRTLVLRAGWSTPRGRELFAIAV